MFGANGTPQTSYGYSGELTDGNQLVHLRRRYMSPALGQFVSLDPLEVFNRYAYVNANPVNRVDPSGLLLGFGGGSSGGGGSTTKTASTIYTPTWGANATPNPQPPVQQPNTSTVFWGANATPNPQPSGGPVKTTTIIPGSSTTTNQPTNETGSGNSNVQWGENASPNPPQTVRQNICAASTLADAGKVFAWGPTELIDLYLAKVKAGCLLEDENLTDLERLAQLSDTVASGYQSDPKTYLRIMSEVVLGVYSGPISPLRSALANGCTGWGRDPHDCRRNFDRFLWLADTGFHSDYRDYHNQIFHLWASVDAVGGAYGQGDIIGINRTALTFGGLQVFHEGLQGFLYNLGLPGGDQGSSWQDYALTDMGIRLGALIARDEVKPAEVGDWLRYFMSNPWPYGDVSSLQYNFPLPGNKREDWYDDRLNG